MSEFTEFELNEIGHHWNLPKELVSRLDIYALVELNYIRVLDILTQNKGQLVYKGEKYDAKLVNLRVGQLVNKYVDRGYIAISFRKIGYLRVALMTQNKRGVCHD